MLWQTMVLDKHRAALSPRPPSRIHSYVLGTRLEGKSVYESSCIAAVPGHILHCHRVLLRGYIATYWGPGSRESLFTSPVALQQCLDTYCIPGACGLRYNYVLTTTCDLERGGARKWNITAAKTRRLIISRRGSVHFLSTSRVRRSRKPESSGSAVQSTKVLRDPHPGNWKMTVKFFLDIQIGATRTRLYHR